MFTLIGNLLAKQQAESAAQFVKIGDYSFHSLRYTVTVLLRESYVCAHEIKANGGLRLQFFETVSSVLLMAGLLVLTRSASMTQ
eukprot:scaffold63419_cov52-Cyclotella_meneghiniana.AAC.3